MVRVSPASPSKWMATRSPLPASTWRSTQLWATLSCPPTNHFANGASSQSSDALEVLRPRDAGAGLLGPEPLVVVGRGVVHRGGAVGLRGERRVGREVHLVHVAGQAVVGHGVLLLVECQVPSQPAGGPHGNRLPAGMPVGGRRVRRAGSPDRGGRARRGAPRGGRRARPRAVARRCVRGGMDKVRRLFANPLAKLCALCPSDAPAVPSKPRNVESWGDRPTRPRQLTRR